MSKLLTCCVAPGWFEDAPLALAHAHATCPDPSGARACRASRRRSCHGLQQVSIPNVSLVVFDAVFFEKHAKLLLEHPIPVMFFLIVNVNAQRIQICRPD